MFVIGRPGAGKSTFCRYVRRALGNGEILLLNDYELLLKRKDKLTAAQFKQFENGQFEILDRTIFDELCDELAQAAMAARGKRLTIVEFSRADYVETFKRFPSLLNPPFIIIYVHAPIDVCIRRNAMRAPDQLVNTVPESVIRKFFDKDDRDKLITTYSGRVRLLDGSVDSLSWLEREVVLTLGELFGDNKVLALKGNALRKELFAASLVLFYIFAFTALALLAWRVSEQSWLGLLAPNASSILLLKTIGLVMAGGGLGSTTYCMRSLYHYYIEGSFDFDRFKWWYAFRPIAGSLLALSIFVIAKGGVTALGVSSSTTSANLTWFGIGYLAGFGTEQVIEWLRRASKSIFGESRVQPDDQSA